MASEFDKEQCNLPTKHSVNSHKLWASYILKVGATSALSLSFCNHNVDTSNYHYSETIEEQQTNKIGLYNFLIETPVIDEIDPEQEIIYAATELENSNAIPPKRVIRLKGRSVKNIIKGTVSRV